MKTEWNTDVNLRGENIKTTRKTEFLLVCEEVDMHVKAETTNNMLMSFQKNVTQNHNTGRDITSFDYVAKCRYFRNQNFFHQERRGRLNLWTSYTIWLQILFIHLPCKHIKIRKVIILPVVLYACETFVSHEGNNAD